MPETRRERDDLLKKSLENERSTFVPHWRDLGDYILPRRIRFETTDVNKGDRRNNKIIDNTGTLAARTLRSGMMAGVTSPARPWFQLTVEDEPLKEFGPVKSWLDTVTAKMRSIFLKSNLYRVLPTIYGDIGTFATGAMFVEEDFDKVVRFYSFPIGSYTISNDEKLRVRTFFREFRMTVRQIINKFARRNDGSIDFTNVSDHIKTLYENGDYEQWIDVTHYIKPNDNHDPDKLESKFKKYISVYYESGKSGKSNNHYFVDAEKSKILREKGYDYFPVLCPRWETSGEDAWGSECPGMVALGDIKGLQTMQKLKAQAITKMVKPPMTGPTALRNAKASILPGDITYLDTREGQQGFRPTHEVDPRIKEILLDIQDHQKRISRAFFEDLFLMLAQSDRREITAREIEERHEEKLLALGPVLEQLNDDLLDPLIDIVFTIGMKQGQFPEPPEELQGVDLKVEYISIMAQAQKLAGIANLERFTTFVTNMSAQTGNVEMLDKVDFDQLIDNYGDRMGIDADVIVPDEEVLQVRENRAQGQQQTAMLENIGSAADSAAKLSKASLEDDNALSRVVQETGAG